MSTSTRERLVTATAELMRTQGYAGTSVKQITVAARAPMGSLYHHFPEGKPQIAAAALRTSGAAYIQLLPLLLDPHDDLREAVPAPGAAAPPPQAHPPRGKKLPGGRGAGGGGRRRPPP
ncbi:TetR/AcrR family transcriptional regulator, partial [Nocardia abscessus]|uniref:TetR/AcrR family transcriptional regulator n=1 Tax=Nocardia abscessus TaxID=120957 RepID=UPI0024586450